MRQKAHGRRCRSSKIPSEQFRKGDIFVVSANELIPADGEIIEGAATVNESAITGESAPVDPRSRRRPLRRHWRHDGALGSDQCRVTANPGESFMDRMIGLIEGAKRQKTPNEIALNILLSALTIIFLVVIITLKPFVAYTASYVSDSQGTLLSASSITVLVSLLVCLIPTTIGGLLSAIGIAGIDRMVQHNVLAMSGKAVEAAGDVDVLLLDKTGTITLGNRQATEFVPAPGVTRRVGRRGAALFARRRNARRAQHRRAGQGEVRHSRPRDSRDADTPSSFRSPRRRA